MATVEEVKKLAALARISVDDAELKKFTSEFGYCYLQLVPILPHVKCGEIGPNKRDMRSAVLRHAIGRMMEL